MFARTLITAAAVALSATCSLANSDINQLPAVFSAVPSQERSTGADSRAADDFVLPTGNGHPHQIRIIQVVMMGNGAPSLSRFGVTLFRNVGIFNGGFFGEDRPALPLATRLTATSVLPLQSTSTLRMYLVTFAVPAGEIIVNPGTRLWVSGFARLDDTHAWGMCRTSRPASSGTLGMFSSPFQPHPIFGASWSNLGNFAFRVVTTQP